MTRINLVDPSSLHYKHLVGEYKEITRVFGVARKNQRDILGGRKKLPQEYTLGTGHVLFFADKLKFIVDRYEALTQEMIARGYKPNPIARNELLDGIDSKLFKDYVPTAEAIAINVQRIKDRMKSINSKEM